MKKQTKKPNEIVMTIPMKQNLELTGSLMAAVIAESMDFSDDQVDEMKIAVIEGCLNAFEHSGSRDHKVNLRFIMKEGELQIIIQDHGKGGEAKDFQSDRIAFQSGKLKKRGWGLTLISELMDGVRIYSGSRGTTLIMVKKTQNGMEESRNADA